MATLAIWLFPVRIEVRCLLLAGVACVVLAALFRRKPKAIQMPGAYLLVSEDEGIVRVEDGAVTRVLARWNQPFGTTLLCDRGRTRALIAFTTPETTRYVAVRLSCDEPKVTRRLLSRASVSSDSVALGDLTAGEPALSAEDATTLLATLEERALVAFERIFLTDSHGAPVVLERDELRVGANTFDLRAPLEWRGFLFQEPMGAVTTVFQATWLRQGGVEVVLVAPMPVDVGLLGSGRGTLPGELLHDSVMQRALVRDLRLSQLSPGCPPPEGQRVAIERLFMLPLRRAFDRAPRPARAPHSQPRSSVQGRA